MKRTPVTSPTVKSVGYDPAQQILEIEFSWGGAVYQYFGVTKEAHAALMSAVAIGEYLDKHIKNSHRYARV